MARGQDTGFHPGRKVGADSGPWSKWQVGSAGPGLQSAEARNTYDRNYPHSIHVDPAEGGGYSAEYRHIDQGHGREYTSRYTADTTFRSAGRAQLAAEALANRVITHRGARNYRSQSYEER